jgi:hypothetical protein
VADSREQVVFDLKVQAAHEPGGDAVAASEVGGRLHLMDGPRLVNVIGP